MRICRQVGALGLVVALFMAGCGDDSDPETGSPTSGSPTTVGTTAANGGSGVPTDGDFCTADKAGGSLTMAVYSETAGLDPGVSSGSGFTGGTELTALYDTLMQFNTETGEYEPRLAESVVPNDDYSEWTLKLRPGITFGNGDPFTADAVAASIARHKDPEVRSIHRNNASYVASTEVVDDLTIVFTMESPWAEFPYLLTDEPGMVVNPAVLDSMTPEEFNLAPVGAGAGPYEFVSFAPGEGIVLKAKDDYWGGPVCIDELKFVALNSAQGAYDSLKVGGVDVAFVDDDQTLSQVRADGTGLYSDLLGGQGVLINNGINNSQTPFTNLKLRLAVLAAIDPDAIDQRINSGAGESTSKLFSDKSLYASEVPGPEYDPDAAKALVAEVKAEDGWDGSARIICPATQSDQALAVKTALDAVGFDIEQTIAPTTGDLIQKVITDKDYDLACWSLQLFDAAPFVKLDRFFNSTSSANRNGYVSPEMDAALAELRIADNVTSAREIIGRMQEIANETGSFAVLRAGEPSIVYSDRVHGLTYNAEAMVYFDKAYVTK